MSSHHSHGPSSMWRHFNCPSSYFYSQVSGGKRTKIDGADEGTDEHEEIAKMIVGFPFSRSRHTDAVARFLSDREIHTRKGSKILVEQRLKAEFAEEEAFGTADLVVLDGKKEVIVCDWKTGHWGCSEEEAQVQGELYLAMAVETYKARLPGGFFICYHTYSNKVIWESGWVDHERAAIILNSWEECVTLSRSVTEENAESLCKIGEWCKYCPGASACPAVAKEGEVLTLEVKTMKEMDVKRPPLDWIQGAMAKLPALEAAIKELKALAREALKEDPDSIPSHRLADSGSTTTVSHEQDLQIWEELKGILTGEEFAACHTLTLSTLKTLIQAKGRDWSQLEESFISRGLITQVPKQKSLRPRAKKDRLRLESKMKAETALPEPK